MQNHRVHDVSVMPGVVFLDLTARVLEARGHAWTGYALERVLFSEPVVTSADGDRELRVRIWLPEGDSGSVLVDSRVWGDDGAFTENMRAALVLDRDPLLPALVTTQPPAPRPSRSTKARLNRSAQKGLDERVKQLGSLLVQRRQVRADDAVDIRPIACSEAPGNLLLDLGHAHSLLGHVVRERHVRVGHETPNVIAVIA
ncbi:hypothetical protein D5039_12555 [Verminephrobacter aporrectodeae subsp. tuberculatae]|uniref:Polyketide synthase dehydratase domain-containing protein n=1 Tax=Verminephrobacter aporrectodeae subsp. tuberculatae TaxID=1110392 RepID=A0ABT3KUC7_9BURK|nr:hypothetical protein [Verminephrobacter aporrectodeae subsp. tuberculatae]